MFSLLVIIIGSQNERTKNHQKSSKNNRAHFRTFLRLVAKPVKCVHLATVL